jgi:hypothetical protein
MRKLSCAVLAALLLSSSSGLAQRTFTVYGEGDRAGLPPSYQPWRVCAVGYGTAAASAAGRQVTAARRLLDAGRSGRKHRRHHRQDGRDCH